MVSRKSEVDEDGEVADHSGLDRSELKPVMALPKSLQAKLTAGPGSAVTKKRGTTFMSSRPRGD